MAQRIARGRFVLDGKVYHTYINDGRNAIHGMLAACFRDRIVMLGMNPMMHGEKDGLFNLLMHDAFRWSQRVQQSHLDGEGVCWWRRLPIHHAVLP